MPRLKDVDAVFSRMAESLCEGQDAVAVLAGVLSVTYGKSLDESHYGRITEITSPRERRIGTRGGNPNQKRLFVQLGRRDGFNPREIAAYFSEILHIPGRQVDHIDVRDSFSLISLPNGAADRVLDMARRDSNLPHIHIDTQPQQSGRDRRFGRDTFRERSFARAGRGRETGARGGSRGNARPRVHTPTERTSASAYKKSNRKEY